MKSAEYWAGRFEALEKAQINRGIAYYNRLSEQYEKASANIQKDINAWYARFAVNNEISITDARKLLTTKELKEFKWTVEDYIKHGEENAITDQWRKELENASARVHISRLESLQLQMQQQIETLYGSEIDGIDGMLRDIYENGYYRSAYEIMKGTGVGVSFAQLDTRRLDKLMSTPWAADGKTFSDRVWANKSALVNELNTTLTQAIIRGQNPYTIVKGVAHRLGVHKSSAGRLIMTEAAYISQAAQKDCYKELDVEQYQFIATLDSRTSEICQAMDGQIFPMSAYQIGVTAPPLHPNCRSTTVPYFEGNITERWARDVESGEGYTVPGDMTYKAWKEQQDALYGEGTVDNARKRLYNGSQVNSRDKEQFDRYTAVLEELAPKTIEEFIEIKSNPEEWKTLKAKYRTANSYKVDSGNISKSEILRMDKTVITEKRDNFTNKYKRSGNIAGAYIDGDTDNLVYAHSRLNETRKGYKGDSTVVLLKENRRFKYTDVLKNNGVIRTDTFEDTEAKLFEYFADVYENKPFKSITMLSERGMCDSCKGVMEQFKNRYPDVEINVVSNKHVEGNVWKYRMRGDKK